MPNDLAHSPGMTPDAAADAIESGAGLGLFDEASADAGGQTQTRSGKPVSDRPWNEGEQDYEPQEVSDSLVEDGADGADDEQEASDDEAKAAESGDDDDEAEGEGGENTSEADDDIVEITIDGQTRQVPLNELAQAYTSKQKGELDFEARVNDLTNQAQNLVSQHIQQVSGVRAQLVQQLQQLQQYQASRMPSPPDPSLADPQSPNYDPDKYTHQLAMYQKADGENRALQHHIQAQQAQMQQEQQATLETMRTTQRTALMQKWPEWNDPAVRQQFLSDVQAEYGFSDEEVGSIYDHRFYLLARDAVAARKAQKAGEKPVKRIQKTAKPAGKPAQAKANAGKGKGRQDALQRVRRTSRLEDIAAAFEDHLPQDIL